MGTDSREQLIVSHIPVAKSVALRMHAKLAGGVERDELVGAALLGLTAAAAQYDASTGVPFVCYARTRMRGSILDMLRQMDCLPRQMRTIFNRSQAAYWTLAAWHGRWPADAEIAAAIGVDAAELDAARIAATRAAVGAPVMDSEDGEPADLIEAALDTRDNAEASALKAEFKDMLLRSVAELPTRQRLLITLRYLRGWTLRKAAGKLGVSPVYAWQIQRSALRRLRQSLSPAL